MREGRGGEGGGKGRGSGEEEEEVGVEGRREDVVEVGHCVVGDGSVGVGEERRAAPPAALRRGSTERSL